MNVAILHAYNDRPIAFNRHFVTIGCGINGALMLSQAIYWSSRTNDADGWFYKTQAEWEEETGMTRREQESARKRLAELGVMHEVRRGVPAKLYYKVDVIKVHELLLSALEVDDEQRTFKNGGKRQSGMAESANLLYTENTTENTNNGLAENQDLFGNDSDAKTESTELSENLHIGKPTHRSANDHHEKTFESFWKSYPRKTNKKGALKVWLRIKPDDDLLKTIMSAVAKQKRSSSWVKDNGKFIPHASTWLNNERWTDEVDEADYQTEVMSDTDDYMMGI